MCWDLTRWIITRYVVFDWWRNYRNVLEPYESADLLFPQNFAMMSEFMTEMGRIKSPNETGLRPVNQRKMAKAIRRAIGMGIHPSTHRHQNILFTESRPGPMIR